MGHGETILLVDDDLFVRETDQDVLEHLGYNVITADDGNKAVRLCLTHATSISAVIMDIVMPNMQGVEAAGLIKKRVPTMPIILVTGYDKKNILDEKNKSMADVIISKPYSIEKVSRILQDLLTVQ